MINLQTRDALVSETLSARLSPDVLSPTDLDALVPEAIAYGCCAYKTQES